METFLCTCNSYPRSRHAEADAQVTLEALCLLHNAPAQIQGRERRNGWFLDRTVSAQIEYLLTLLWLQVRCVLIAALENPKLTSQESAITYIHNKPSHLSRLSSKKRGKIEHNTDHSLTQKRHRKPSLYQYMPYISTDRSNKCSIMDGSIML